MRTSARRSCVVSELSGTSHWTRVGDSVVETPNRSVVKLDGAVSHRCASHCDQFSSWAVRVAHYHATRCTAGLGRNTLDCHAIVHSALRTTLPNQRSSRCLWYWLVPTSRRRNATGLSDQSASLSPRCTAGELIRATVSVWDVLTFLINRRTDRISRVGVLLVLAFRPLLTDASSRN